MGKSLSLSAIGDSHHSNPDSEKQPLREYILVELRGEARHHDAQSKHDGSRYCQHSRAVGVKYSSHEAPLGSAAEV